MDEREFARMRAVPKNAAWVLWAALQVGIVLLLGIAAVLKTVGPGLPLLKDSPPFAVVIDAVLPALAVLPIVVAIFIYQRNVAHGPWPNGRVARKVGERLLAARTAGDPARFAADTVLLLDGNFLGASILSWAVGEGGALLAGIYTLLRGFQPAGIAIVVLWLLSMVFAAPTAIRRDRYRRRLLRAGGLEDAQVEQLLASIPSS